MINKTPPMRLRDAPIGSTVFLKGVSRPLYLGEFDEATGYADLWGDLNHKLAGASWIVRATGSHLVEVSVQ